MPRLQWLASGLKIPVEAVQLLLDYGEEELAQSRQVTDEKAKTQDLEEQNVLLLDSATGSGFVSDLSAACDFRSL